MKEALLHRGPDDHGTLIRGPAGLGHRRLSIIDLEGGHQPLSNETGDVWTVFNGEIYNFRELKRDLQAKGHHFATETDTEVLVHLYEEHGDRCVERLRGMFAFAIWDAQRARLLLARDPLGQKPLFYTRDASGFAFASEVKALIRFHTATPGIDLSSLHAYLALRFVPSPGTMFEGIHALPPGHRAVLSDGDLRLESYWEPEYLPKWTTSEEELTDELEELMRDAVRSHLVSDVPLGTFLSGGIDSSLMTAMVAEREGGGVPTFSIGSEAEDYDELPLARLVARRFGTAAQEEVVQPDLIQFLPDMVYQLDMPGDPIAACQYYAARLASRHVKVAIGGDGGDELFGGYDRFRGFGMVDLYAAVPSFLRQRIAGPLLDMLSDSFTYKSTVAKLRWVHTLSFHEQAARYAESTTYFRFDQRLADRLYTPETAGKLQQLDARRAVIDAFNAADADEVLDRMLHADLTTRLPEHLMILVDRMTMAHSIEARSPFLDRPLVEFAARLPVEYKIRGKSLKYLERQVARRHLPQEITDAPKRGFMFPIAYWLQDELRVLVRELLEQSRLVEHGLFRGDALRSLLDEHAAGKVDHHHRIWMLVNLEIWHRLYMEGNSVDTVREQLAELAGLGAASDRMIGVG